MASKRQRGSSWEFTVKRAGVLERPLTLTFGTEAEGDEYCARLEALLDRGIVPDDYQPKRRTLTIEDLTREYERNVVVPRKDGEMLSAIRATHGARPVDGITAAWVDDWIVEMRRINHHAPATIRAKVGALARCCDWAIRKKLVSLPDHPLRTLRAGYAAYTAADAVYVKPRIDIERERRLEGDEEARIIAAIQGLDDPDRALLELLFRLALETGMRLSELYTTTPDQVDLQARAIFLQKTKNGDSRSVPLSTVAVQLLHGFAGFPWLDRHKGNRKLTTNYLSKLFIRTIFDIAGCDDLKFHDLRHEAVSRFFEKSSMTTEEIMKCSGHKSHRMMMRYLKLRPTTLAAKLW
jgi:integrase